MYLWSLSTPNSWNDICELLICIALDFALPLLLIAFFILWTCSVPQTQETLKIVEMHWSHSAFWKSILIHIKRICVCFFVCLLWFGLDDFFLFCFWKRVIIMYFEVKIMCPIWLIKRPPCYHGGSLLSTTSLGCTVKLMSLALSEQ